LHARDNNNPCSRINETRPNKILSLYAALKIELIEVTFIPDPYSLATFASFNMLALKRVIDITQHFAIVINIIRCIILR